MTTEHTKGKAVVANYNDKEECFEVNVGNDFFVCKTTFNEAHKEEAKANAELIAEAFNVSNETGKTPRMLADENLKLIQALEGVLNNINGNGDIILRKHGKVIEEITTSNKQH